MGITAYGLYGRQTGIQPLLMLFTLPLLIAPVYAAGRDNDSISRPPQTNVSTQHEITELQGDLWTLVRELETDFPERIQATLLRGDLHQQLGQHQKAVEIWQTLLKQQPRHVELLSRLGMAALEMERYDQAIAYWRRALALQPQLPGLNQDIGFALLESGRYREAISAFQAELNFQPRAKESLNLMGQCYLQLKDYEQAQKTYQKVLEYHPKDATATFGLLTVAQRLQQTDKANVYRKRFHDLRSDSSDLMRGGYSQAYDLVQTRRSMVPLILNAGDLYRRHGRESKANTLLNWALRLDSKQVVGHLKKQVIDYKARQQDTQALILMEQITRLEPNNADNYLALGMLSLKTGKLDQAQAAFAFTIELAPQMADGYRALARLYAQRGIHAREIVALSKQAIALEASAEDYYILSRAHMSLGQMTEALQAIQQAVDREPKHPHYRQAFEYLQKKMSGPSP